MTLKLIYVRATVAFLVLSLIAIPARTQHLPIPAPSGSGQFGKSISVLANGNYVITDPFYDDGAVIDVGAVYLFDGATNTIISVLKGSSANDMVGGDTVSNSIVVLKNGNFLVRSPYWHNGAAANAGAVTWVNGIAGLSGVVSNTNSLVGTTLNDSIANVILLDSINYLVSSKSWDNGPLANAGFVTWCDGNTGTSGDINSSNSLVGSHANDQVGNITVLANKNYVVCSPLWDNGAIANAGAVTWASLTTGKVGVITNANSLVGLAANNNIGIGGIKELSNGNFVISNYLWDNGGNANAGAATWVNGATGITGSVSATNSIRGFGFNDSVGYKIHALTNGNYVVASPGWNNGAMLDAGAVTWGNGATGTAGFVGPLNSLIGPTANLRVGDGEKGVVTLANGNYVVSTINWVSSGRFGAVTWRSGSTAAADVVAETNSLIGYGSNVNITPLHNGNYVAYSPFWGYDRVVFGITQNVVNAGAVSFCNGTMITAAFVDTSNTLFGSNSSDLVGAGGILALANGNYVVLSPWWENRYTGGDYATKAGAATWADGTTGIIGQIHPTNSLVGTHDEDFIGRDSLALPSGNYVVGGNSWDNAAILDAGAVVWGNGTTGSVGPITSSNALIGSHNGDNVGTGVAFASPFTLLSNGNFLVNSRNWQFNTGAVSLGNGNSGITGVLSNSNSLTGYSTLTNLGASAPVELDNGAFAVYTNMFYSSPNSGSVTVGNIATGISGQISLNNSLIGATTNDLLNSSVTALPNGWFVVRSPNWNNGAISKAGAITIFENGDPVAGHINICRGITGTTPDAGADINFGYNPVHDNILVAVPSENKLLIYQTPPMPQLAVADDTVVLNYPGGFPMDLVSGTCQLIAGIGLNSATKSPIKAKVWLDDTVIVVDGHPFVQRHYEMAAPPIQSSTTTYAILYFTQQEFDALNAHDSSLLDLPTSPTDDLGKANLRIAQYTGVSSDGSGLPGSYSSGLVAELDPIDTDIVWNSALSRWEVTVPVIGLGGLLARAVIPPALPLTLIEFNGRVDNDNALLNWKTTDEVNTSSFDVERSLDGRNFTIAGNVIAANQPGINFYAFTDPQINSFGVPLVYYRLKQIDIDGRYEYSPVIILSIDNSRTIVNFYPNPVNGQAKLVITINEAQHITGKVIDNNGRVVLHHQWRVPAGSSSLSFDAAGLSKGLYYLEINGEKIAKRIRFVKL